MSKKRLVIEKRASGTSGSLLLAQFVGILLAILTTVIFFLATGRSVGQTLNILNSLIVQSFFSYYGIIDTINKAIPLIITSLGISIAFRMKLWNIGGEGQIMMGALGSAGIAIAFPNLSGVVLVPLMILGAIVCGATWALLAAIPRAYLNVNETIFTLMLNYVAVILVTHMVHGPWRDKDALGFPIAPILPTQGTLPTIFGSPIQMGFIIGLILCVVYWLVLTRSRWGYEIRVIGESTESARYAGIDVRKNILYVLAASGAFAGLAGWSELASNTHRLEVNLSSGYGYTAIIIAWLARMNSAGVIAMSIFMAGVLVGGTNVRADGVPAAVAVMIQGCILLFVLACDRLTHYRFRIEEIKSEVSEKGSDTI